MLPLLRGTGQRIVGAGFLREWRADKVIVINRVYVDEIGEELESLGVKAELLAVTGV